MAITTITKEMVSVNAIQGTLIADNAITAVHIATNAVSGTLIADNAVTATHIAQNTITVTQLADDCVESAKIADGIITTNHLNKAMISSQTEVTPVAGDFVLIGDTSDSNNLKKAATAWLPLAGGTLTGGLTGTTGTFSTAGNGNSPTIHIIDTADTEVAWFEGNRAGDTGAFINVRHNPSTPQETNRSGIRFQADDDGGNVTNYARITQYIEDHTNTTEDGRLAINVMSDGSDNEVVNIRKDQFIYTGDAGSSFIRVDNRADGHDTGFEIYQNGSRMWELHSDDSRTNSLQIRPSGNSYYEFSQSGVFRVGLGNIADATVVIDSASGGDPTLIFDTGAANRTGVIRFKDEGTVSGFINYEHNGNKLNFGSGSSSTVTMCVNDGKVGIGTTSPAGHLHVHGSGDGYLYITGDGNPLKGGRIIGHDGGLTFQPNTGSDSTYSEAMRITTDKHVGIGHTSPSTRLYVHNSGGGSSDCMTVQSGSTANSNVGMILFRDNDGDYCGQITTNGSTNTSIYNANTSDERLKENITDWDIDALSLFKTIEPKEFNFKSQDEGAPKVRGYIAQKEASKFPEAFTTDTSEEAYYSYNPSGMVIYLMKALKEQVAINEALEARIKTLEEA